nr:hypothetical protein [Streptomyces sp. YIM 132580]
MAGGPQVRCFAEGDAHDFPIEDGTGAYCPEHGVTLLWRGEPIAGGDPAGGVDTFRGELAAGADGPYSVVCRGASVSDLAATHAICRQPGCACPCHVTAAALREAG